MNNKEKKEADDLMLKHFRLMTVESSMSKTIVAWLQGLIYSAALYQNRNYSEMVRLLNDVGIKETTNESM